MSTTSEPHTKTQPLEAPSERAVKRLLYPTDFSESARAGLRYATALARDMNAVLIIAHAEEPMETYAGGQFYGPDERIREQLRKTLEDIVPPDRTVAYSYHYETKASGAAAGILGIAKTENVELIVMGTHGRTGRRHVLVGGVTEKVVREAPCPVVTFTRGALAHELEKGEQTGGEEMAKQQDSMAAEIGCWIKVKEVGADEEETYQLTRVTNAMKNELAQDNPMGKAFIGARAGDEVTVHGPSGPIKFSVLDIGTNEAAGG